MGRKSNYSESYKREAVTKAKVSGDIVTIGQKIGVS
jgi:hypothetical protein